MLRDFESRTVKARALRKRIREDLQFLDFDCLRMWKNARAVQSPKPGSLITQLPAFGGVFYLMCSLIGEPDAKSAKRRAAVEREAAISCGILFASSERAAPAKNLPVLCEIADRLGYSTSPPLGRDAAGIVKVMFGRGERRFEELQAGLVAAIFKAFEMRKQDEADDAADELGEAAGGGRTLPKSPSRTL
ncbi:hypothetical protein LXA47_31235 [Massilia sp. P8910]|uniref:hypothetical protein n=1 Tax=Massilia antarctica TaxID=2765360 RepID=UPI001E2F49F8|nr:hypothetical protein [Massilia antarctica]MCE3608045.1 hypothetical protein [Massilia antarctica]